MPDIFISYSKQERQLTEDLAKYLEAEGYVVWWDTSLVTGENFRSAIKQQLDDARAVIVVWTRSSVNSDWVVSEAEHAARQTKLIPLRAADLLMEQIPNPFNVRHTEVVENRGALKAALLRLNVEPRYAKGEHGSLHDRFWREIEGSEHPEDFEQYLKEFPEGQHAAFARLKVARLKRVAQVVLPTEALAVGPPPENGRRPRQTAWPAVAASVISSGLAALGLWQGVLAPQDREMRASLSSLASDLKQDEAERKRHFASIDTKLDKAMLELQRPLKDDDDEWAAADREGLLRSWESYIKKRPSGVNVRLADRRMKERLEKGRLVTSLEGHDGAVTRIESSPTDATILSQDDLNFLIGWESAYGKVKSKTRLPHTSTKPTGYLNRLDNLVCTPSRVGVYDLAPQVQFLTDSCAMGWVAFKSRERELRIGKGFSGLVTFSVIDSDVLLFGAGQSSWVVDFANKRITERQGGSASGAAAATSRGKVKLLAIVQERQISLLRNSDLSEIASITGHRGAIRSIQFSGDGALLLTGGDDGVIRVWDVSDLQ